MSRESILKEIDRERDRQDKMWGGADHDDTHTHHDWAAFITAYVGQAVFNPGGGWKFDRRYFRSSMIKIAALAVAAAEWCDRKLVPQH